MAYIIAQDLRRKEKPFNIYKHVDTCHVTGQLYWTKVLGDFKTRADAEQFVTAKRCVEKVEGGDDAKR
jgi:hypothetical protein